MARIFFGEWDSVADVLKSFRISNTTLNGATVFIAAYELGDWVGAALVIYERDGKLYEVNASHCSCSGLEEQWEPEECDVRTLAHRMASGWRARAFAEDVHARLSEIVASRMQAEAI